MKHSTFIQASLLLFSGIIFFSLSSCNPPTYSYSSPPISTNSTSETAAPTVSSNAGKPIVKKVEKTKKVKMHPATPFRPAHVALPDGSC